MFSGNRQMGMAALQSLTGLLLGLVLVSSVVRAQSGASFPRPAELEPAVTFWTRVYTEVDTRSGFLHDSQHLAIIYARLPLDRQQIEANRTRIREDLRVLASGRRNNLTDSQAEILALWPEGVSNETLRTATSNVRWQLGQSDRFKAGLQRSGAYREHIRRVIEEKDLPIELAVLPHVESSFNPSAYSSAAAAGMWQFGRTTGRRFMRIDHIVDERMDPYIATNAAMSLLEYNYSVLGTWPLALTAYNHGAGGVARAVRQTGTTDIETIIANYRGRAFGFASRNFYPQFLAVLDVENQTKQFFGEVSLDAAPKFTIVETDAYIEVDVFARSLGVSLERLRADNPALRPVVWEGNKRIPKGFPVKLRSVTTLGPDLLARIPANSKYTMQTPDVEYVVTRGDSLSVIARRFDTTVSQLVALNQLRSRHRIQIGQRLLLPQDTNAVQLTENAAPPAEGLYTVRRGDTVSRIAARYGVTEQDLLAVNGTVDRNRIFPGQLIRLPGFEPETVDQSLPATNAMQEVGIEDKREELESASETIAASELAAVQPSPTEAIAEVSSELGVEQENLPPAAVLLDNQQLEVSVTREELEAEAIDPEQDISESNEQLVEVLSADPSDYTVASNNSIEIQASETLGHYAEWLGIRAWDIRRLNGMAYRDPVIVGKRLRLDFSKVSIVEFERARRDFHSTLQQEFFANYRIRDVETYNVRSGDNLGTIARERYSTPVWLLRQYNPELDLDRIQIGQQVVLPLVEQVN
ncbi:MAG: LysM peptidoglycan-binding domain-containing protein [Gammaproteobacteria bacterium]|nr:LysM peptidoglycan-binding domain-containing protein [Gammaproteobacteria bacterium]